MIVSRSREVPGTEAGAANGRGVPPVARRIGLGGCGERRGRRLRKWVIIAHGKTEVVLVCLWFLPQQVIRRGRGEAEFKVLE